MTSLITEPTGKLVKLRILGISGVVLALDEYVRTVDIEFGLEVSKEAILRLIVKDDINALSPLADLLLLSPTLKPRGKHEI